MRVTIAGDRFRTELAKRAIDQKAFARIAHLSEETISAAARGRRVQPSTLRAIAIALAKVPIVDDDELVTGATG